MLESAKRVVLALACAGLVFTGCGKREAEQGEAKPPAVQQDTTAAAKRDTAPEPPPGYKSIHQLELEQHKAKEP